MAKSKEKVYRKKSKASASEIKSDEVYVHDSDDGGVKTDDDESIADSGSEVGWNSGDETAFNKNKGDDSSDDDDEDFYDEEDGLQDGEVLLSDLLGGNSKFSSFPSASSSSSKNTIDTREYFDNSADESEDDDDDDEEEEDEEDESDEEGGGEDNTDDEDEEESEDDDDSNDDSDGDNHDGLLAMIDKYSKGAGKKKSVNHGAIVSQSAKESEFSSMMGAKGNNAVSMEELLGALEGSGGGDMTSMKQTLTGLVQSKGPPKHVDKVVADRVERSLSYKDKSEDMKKWHDTVTDNKNARTLDLAQDRRQLPSYRSLIKNYEASTDMEKEVQMILLNGKDEAGMEQAEEDELGSSNLTQEELKARQDELGKVRALLFYEQMKRHRVNKIKSKAYHRILKRKKKREEEKGKEALQEMYDSEDDNEQMKNMTEEEAVRRIKERMDLRHHNTSKWARMAAKHSNGNKSLREAYHESVLLGHELANKANNASSGPLEDGEHSDEGHWSDENTTGGKGKRSTTKKAAGDIVNALQAAGEDVELDGKYGGLYKMDFMKKAKERQQDRAREEATDILRDLEEMEREADRGDSSDEDGQKNKKGSKKRSAEDMEKLSAAREEMKAKMGGSSSMVLSKASTGSSTSVSTGDNTEEHNPWLNVTSSQARSTEVMAGKKSKKVKADSSNDVLLNTQSWDDNKLLSGDGTFQRDQNDNIKNNNEQTPSKSKKKKSKGKKKASGNDEASDSTSKETNEEVVVKKPLMSSNNQTQAALVSAAFAGPDYEDEFGALKEKMVDEELDIVGKKRQIESADKAGWGDWAGPGKVGVSQRVVKKRKHLLKNLEEKAAQQRAGRNDGQLANVILSERRVKTSSKYKIADIPHPFTSREEYERSLQMPLGDEWNAAHIVKKNVKPEILTRAGRIIEPISLPKNYKKSAASSTDTAKRIIPNNGNKIAKSKALNRTAKFF